ncbi:MAG: SocA family protein [Bacteroidales bacterium]|nr:SocA family protein [Bacteroidales bacterium]
MCKISNITKEKLGNAVIFIAERCPDTSKTKLLKLLYLMEEKCALIFQTPFLGLDYEVWQAGPVQKDIYIEISDGASGLLNDYIKVVQRGDAQYIEPKKAFCDDEFSDAEISVMEKIVDEFGHYTATQLVKYVHKPGSIWYETAKRENLLEVFDRHESNNSNVVIDFSSQMTECDKSIYQERLNIHQSANLMRVSANV